MVQSPWYMYVSHRAIYSYTNTEGVEPVSIAFESGKQAAWQHFLGFEIEMFISQRLSAGVRIIKRLFCPQGCANIALHLLAALYACTTHQ